MKVEKLSISVPEQLIRYAKKRTEELSKQRGSRVTLSSYLAERIAEDKAKEEQQKEAA